jgi:hypothetical protein
MHHSHKNFTRVSEIIFLQKEKKYTTHTHTHTHTIQTMEVEQMIKYTIFYNK